MNHGVRAIGQTGYNGIAIGIQLALSVVAATVASFEVEIEIVVGASYRIVITVPNSQVDVGGFVKNGCAEALGRPTGKVCTAGIGNRLDIGCAAGAGKLPSTGSDRTGTGSQTRFFYIINGPANVVVRNNLKVISASRCPYVEVVPLHQLPLLWCCNRYGLKIVGIDATDQCRGRVDHKRTRVVTG